MSSIPPIGGFDAEAKRIADRILSGNYFQPPLHDGPVPISGKVIETSPHLIAWPFPGMVYDYRTGRLRWEQPGDHLIYRPVSMWAVGEKLVQAFKDSLKYVDKDVREQLEKLFAPENLPYFVGALVLWAGSHFFGVGEVFDAGMMILAVVMLGAEAGQVGSDLWSFLDLAVNANSLPELDQAGQHMSRVIAVVGVEGLATNPGGVKFWRWQGLARRGSIGRCLAGL